MANDNDKVKFYPDQSNRSVITPLLTITGEPKVIDAFKNYVTKRQKEKASKVEKKSDEVQQFICLLNFVRFDSIKKIVYNSHADTKKVHDNQRILGAIGKRWLDLKFDFAFYSDDVAHEWLIENSFLRDRNGQKQRTFRSALAMKKDEPNKIEQIALRLMRSSPPRQHIIVESGADPVIKWMRKPKKTS